MERTMETTMMEKKMESNGNSNLLGNDWRMEKKMVTTVVLAVV